jgi:hypothetical protein
VELDDLRQENKKLLQQVSVLEKELKTYKDDGVRGFFNNINRWVNNANEYIFEKATNIGSLVTGEGKDFERVMALIKNTKENVEAIMELEKTLGIKRESPQAGVLRTTPESIADVLGDNKQQQV